jgi:hypothetical protein
MERLEGMTEEQQAEFEEWLDYASPGWREMLALANKFSDGTPQDIRNLLAPEYIQAPFLVWKLGAKLDAIGERISAIETAARHRGMSSSPEAEGAAREPLNCYRIP